MWIILKILAAPLSLIYTLVTSARNLFYDNGWFHSYRPKVFTLVVGNLTVGGTGKTPHVENLIKSLKNDFKLAIVSRGYGRKTKGLIVATPESTPEQIGDELCQLAHKFRTGIHFIACEKRVDALKFIETKCKEVDLVILDDAFQHRSLKAHFYILLSDYKRLYFNDFVLPSGWLREWRTGAERADAIVITKLPESLDDIPKQKIMANSGSYSSAPVYFSSFGYGKCYSLLDSNEKVDWKSKQLILVTGIAQPDYLINFLSLESAVVKTFLYPDHHPFSIDDLRKIEDFAKNTPHALLITTEKDAVKLKSFSPEMVNRFWVLPIEVVWHENGDQYILNAIKKSYQLNALS